MGLFSLLLSSFAYAWLSVTPGIWKSGLGYFLSHDGLHFGIVSLFVACLLSVCILAALFVFAAQAFTSWLFGWTLFSRGFLVEVAIEPLPFGKHSLGHIDWAASPIGLDGLLHSWTYAHPVAIIYLQNWVRERLEGLPEPASLKH
jgi:hypothetical protein